MIDVEPVIKSQLEKMIPRTLSAPDWAEIVRRAHAAQTETRSLSRRRLRLSRPAAVLLVFVTAAVVAAAAYAVVHYSGRSRYPEPVPGVFSDLATNISAINHPRGHDDQLTPEAARIAKSLAAELPANAENQSMRVFTSPASGPVYVLPARRGFAFIASGGTVVPSGLAAIVPGILGETDPVAGGILTSSDGPGVVFGIASDDVTGVDVIVGPHVYSATMLRNGYYWVQPDTSIDVRTARIQTHLKDGSVING